MINKVHSYLGFSQDPISYDVEENIKYANKEIAHEQKKHKDKEGSKSVSEDSKSLNSDKTYSERTQNDSRDDFHIVDDEEHDEKLRKYCEYGSKPHELQKLKRMLQLAGVNVYRPVLQFELDNLSNSQNNLKVTKHKSLIESDTKDSSGSHITIDYDNIVWAYLVKMMINDFVVPDYECELKVSFVYDDNNKNITMDKEIIERERQEK